MNNGNQEVKNRFSGNTIVPVGKYVNIREAVEKEKAYLRGAYLRGAYLRGAYLREADLSGADGKFRVHRCRKVGEKDLKELGLGK